ncbi:glycoside hydrolase family 43 protein, partial [Bifidobacterium pseudocatenulatum]|nr:glycoside hydrolase family 43 protein [Bifidobacterium pseudocatenulatum]
VKEKKSERWEVVGSAKDVTTLSGGFTGNFVGVGVHDLNKKKGSYADFSFFEYKGRD